MKFVYPHIRYRKLSLICCLPLSFLLILREFVFFNFNYVSIIINLLWALLGLYIAYQFINQYLYKFSITESLFAIFLLYCPIFFLISLTDVILTCSGQFDLIILLNVIMIIYAIYAIKQSFICNVRYYDIKFRAPYSFKEAIGWVSRYIKGPSRNNPGKVNYIPSNYSMNKIEHKQTIVFTGDIMDMGGKDAIIGGNLKRFIKKADFFIGNCEAIVVDDQGISEEIFKSKNPTNKILESYCQKHKPQIINALKSMFPLSKTYLTTANNHAGDFGKESFIDSIRLLKNRGINVFGTKNAPYKDLNDSIRVIGGTMWINHTCDYIVNLADSEKYIKKGAFNILYPHWGYELELYPRLSTVKLGKKLTQKYDMIIGHHSHTPQPITYEENKNAKKLIAYSLADFCRRPKKSRCYGIILKAEVGKSEDGVYQVGKVNWKFVKTFKNSKKDYIIEIVNNCSLLEKANLKKSIKILHKISVKILFLFFNIIIVFRKNKNIHLRRKDENFQEFYEDYNNSKIKYLEFKAIESSFIDEMRHEEVTKLKNINNESHYSLLYLHESTMLNNQLKIAT